MEKKYRPKRDTFAEAARNEKPPIVIDNLTIDIVKDGAMRIVIDGGEFITNDFIQVATIRNRLSAILEIMKKNPARGEAGRKKINEKHNEKFMKEEDKHKLSNYEKLVKERNGVSFGSL